MISDRPEADVRMFAKEDPEAVAGALKVGQEWLDGMGWKKSLTIQCLDCKKMMYTEAAMLDHAKAFGHKKFDIDDGT